MQAILVVYIASAKYDPSKNKNSLFKALMPCMALLLMLNDDNMHFFLQNLILLYYKKINLEFSYYFDPS